MARLEPHVPQTFRAVPESQRPIARTARKQPVVRMKRQRLDWLRMTEHHLHELTRVQIEDPNGKVDGGNRQKLFIGREGDGRNRRADALNLSYQFAVGRINARGRIRRSRRK